MIVNVVIMIKSMTFIPKNTSCRNIFGDMAKTYKFELFIIYVFHKLLYSSYYVPGIILSTLHTLAYLIFLTLL